VRKLLIARYRSLTDAKRACQLHIYYIPFFILIDVKVREVMNINDTYLNTVNNDVELPSHSFHSRMRSFIHSALIMIEKILIFS
jgi:hypothetical protein